MFVIVLVFAAALYHPLFTISSVIAKNLKAGFRWFRLNIPCYFVNLFVHAVTNVHGYDTVNSVLSWARSFDATKQTLSSSFIINRSMSPTLATVANYTVYPSNETFGMGQIRNIVCVLHVYFSVVSFIFFNVSQQRPSCVWFYVSTCGFTSVR